MFIQEVLLHGLVCDAYGKKMSKTTGNIVSPENIINGITLNVRISMGVLFEKNVSLF